MCKKKIIINKSSAIKYRINAIENFKVVFSEFSDEECETKPSNSEI